MGGVRPKTKFSASQRALQFLAVIYLENERGDYAAANWRKPHVDGSINATNNNHRNAGAITN